LLGLRYQVVGLENLPANGCFIVAAKHQSAWETLKLHLILTDPAVVLKRELTQVPVWGLMARKARIIPVDRGAKGRAIASMLKGALAIKEDGRPILIFPQGTRVAPGAYVPYKVGVALMYDKLKVPLVPMALNSGMFWPRKAYFKRPGTITVQFLPPIPAGLPREEMMARLESVLEEASDRLVQQVGGPPLVRPAASSESPSSEPPSSEPASGDPATAATPEKAAAAQ
jgi:1-acyl-sn-glycerol-3-phosphate acyltransferase